MSDTASTTTGNELALETASKMSNMTLRHDARRRTNSDEATGETGVSIPGFFRAVYDGLGRDIPFDLFETAYYDMDMGVSGSSIGSNTRVNRGNHALFTIGDKPGLGGDYRVLTRGMDNNRDTDRVNAFIRVVPQNTREKATLIAMAERYDDVFVYPAKGNGFVITPGRKFIR